MRRQSNAQFAGLSRLSAPAFLLILALPTSLEAQQGTAAAPRSQNGSPYFGQVAPGDTAELFAPDIITADRGLHSSPVFSPDGSEIFWSVMGDGGIQCLRNDGDRWTQAPAFFARLFGDGGDSPVFSPDGQRLYFVSHNYPRSSLRAQEENIWYVERADTGWLEPHMLDPSVVAGPVHWMIGVSNEGTIVFTSVRDGVIGAYDLYISRLIDGQHVDPANMGRPLNHEGSDATAYLDPEERYLIYASVDRPVGLGMGDLYVGFRQDDESWGSPINLGDRVNSPAQDLCPTVSPDGLYLFFISMRSGISRAYWVSMKVVADLHE